jgi:hypothetical protein
MLKRVQLHCTHPQRVHKRTTTAPTPSTKNNHSSHITHQINHLRNKRRRHRHRREAGDTEGCGVMRCDAVCCGLG